MPSAAILAPNTVDRLGRWVKTVFHVPQPYSLPIVNTPRISTSEPP